MDHSPLYIGRILPRRHPRPLPASSEDEPTIAIRRSRDADLPGLYDLAALDSQRPLHGPVLVATVDGSPIAAVSLSDGRAIADPFRPTAATVELLRMRATQLAVAERAPKPRRRLRLPLPAGRAKA